ncbi:uncharacterized protein LOC108665510 [Hyalella azteca]|uniref:Uncharacterized protein LOC108665510 n=1 Tax=Hyalella azteca TaxID=294128 RepID=A0A8B7N2V4_HYAAZ|nr:uncharacterized protein LOC108665510 [Hyalella azteca]
MASSYQRTFHCLIKLLSLILAVSCIKSSNAPKKSEVLSEIQVNADGQIVYGPKAEIPADKLFQDPAAFCEGCYGLVMEVSKLLDKWEAEEGSMKDHVDTACFTACNVHKLNSYVLSPPKMVKLCTGILGHYEEALTTSLLLAYTRYEKPSPEQLTKMVCREAVPACRTGVQPMSVTRKEDRMKKEKAQEL